MLRVIGQMIVEWLVTAAVPRCDNRLGRWLWNLLAWTCGSRSCKRRGQDSGQGRAGDGLKLLPCLRSTNRAQECLTWCHSW